MNTQSQGAVVVGVAESVFKGWALRWAAEQAQLEGRSLTLVNGSGSINCGSRCTVTGNRNEQVRLTAKVSAGKWRWSDRWPSASRTVTLSNTTRLGITFSK